MADKTLTADEELMKKLLNVIREYPKRDVDIQEVLKALEKALA